MATFVNSDALVNGTAGEDMLILLAGGGGGGTLPQRLGGAGNDVLIASNARAVIVDDAAGNGSIATALNIDAAANWSTAASPLVYDGSVPHALIAGTGANAVDYFAVTVGAGEIITLDVDFGYTPSPAIGGPSFDPMVQIFGADGTMLIYDDVVNSAYPYLDAEGSVHAYDSLLRYVAPSAGTYYIAVSRYPNFAPVLANATYLLNISVTGHAAMAGVASGGAELYGEAGIDYLYGADGNDVLDGGDDGDRLVGGAGGDRLIGRAGADTLVGGVGDDWLYSAGHDPISGPQDDMGREIDLLYGGADTNHIWAGIGDHVHADEGVDYLSYSLGGASAGVNIWTGSFYGHHVVEGGIVSGVEHLVQLRGSEFGDWISVGPQALPLTIDAGGGNDGIVSGDSELFLYGGAGNDYLISGSGADHFIGGEGIDTVDYRRYAEGVTAALGLNGAEGSGAGGDTLTQVENLVGSEFADRLAGNEQGNIIDGRGGRDEMAGGAGDDFYVVDRSDDVVIEAANEGMDRVYSSVSYSIAVTHVEQLLLSGSANIDATGNSLYNAIAGNSGDNVIDGRGGRDTLYGGAGRDQFNFTTPLGLGNIDLITDFSVADDMIGLSRWIFTGAGPAGMLGAGAFHVGAAAADAGDRIIYNSATGALLYDADGTGAAAAVQFARVATGLAMTNADFLLI